MGRRKKQSPEVRARIAKLKRRQERALQRQQFLESLQQQTLEDDYYGSPMWTDYTEDSQIESLGKQNNYIEEAANNKDLHSYLHQAASVPLSTNQDFREDMPQSESADPSEVNETGDGQGKQDLVANVKVEHDIDMGAVKTEVEGDNCEDLQDGHGSEPIDPLSCVEVNEENFVVDCDPLIVAGNSLSSEVNKPMSSDDNSSFSSSSNNIFYTEVMENNELFFKKIAGMPNTTNDAELARALQEHYDKLEEITEQMLEKRKRAAAIQRRRRKRMLEKMSDDELTAYRKTQTEACRMRRIRRLERMSDDERQRDRMLKNALCLARRHRREAMMSDDERKARRAAAAAAQREKRKKKRENMSEDELKAHKAEVAAIWRMRRHLRHMRMSEEELRAERARAAEAKRLSRLKQKEKEGDSGVSTQEPLLENTQVKKKQRRRRSRNQVLESESEGMESGTFGMDGTAESLISQILKQTQHIAALQSEQVDLIPQHPLVELAEKDQGVEQNPQEECPPRQPPEDLPAQKGSENELPNSVQVDESKEDQPHVENEQDHSSADKLPEHQATAQRQENHQVSEQTLEHLPVNDSQQTSQHHAENITDPQPSPDCLVKVKQEYDDDYQTRSPPVHQNRSTVGDQTETPQFHDNEQNRTPQFHREKLQDDAASKQQQYSHSDVPVNNPNEAMHQFHHNKVPDSYHIGMAQHFQHNRLENSGRMEALQQHHHRLYDSNQMMSPHDFYHNRVLYRPPISSLPPFHYNRFHDPHEAGAPHPYHHSKMAATDQTITPQHFHHSNIHDVNQGGIPRELHHKEIQGSQGGTMQQFHYGGSYMNTLY